MVSYNGNNLSFLAPVKIPQGTVGWQAGRQAEAGRARGHLIGSPDDLSRLLEFRRRFLDPSSLDTPFATDAEGVGASKRHNEAVCPYGFYQASGRGARGRTARADATFLRLSCSL